MRYIGSKVQLLETIENVLTENRVKAKTFLDVFSGTGSVGRYFKKKYQVYSNDILYFSYVLQMATIHNDKVPLFVKLEKQLGMSVFDYFENIEFIAQGKFEEHRLFIRNNYSPKGGRNYLTEENAYKIDLWRLELEDWKARKYVDENEYFYLLACIVETIPFFSNISGTYGAFLKTWDPRAVKKIKLFNLDVPSNDKENKSFNLDSEEVLKQIEGDILYIDPPYNERQYLPNYHLLETIAKYDYPIIKGVTGIREYSAQKSLFCQKSKVHEAFENMLKLASFRYIILSYNTDGLMSEDEIVSILSKYSVDGKCKVYRIPHKRYKSRTLVNKTDLYELIFFIEKKDSRILMKPTDIYIKSPLNYTGGKYKQISQLLTLFPSDISIFVDLFCGGLNVGINVKCDKVIAVDINKFIIEMFEYLRSQDVNLLINKIESLIVDYKLSKTNEEGYLLLRSAYNAKPSPLLLFVLTCYSFNHQIRYNNNFEFNCPFGKNRSSYNPNIKKNLIKFVNALYYRNFDFYASDFSVIDIDSLDSNSLVYCDPPYFITTGSYNDGTRGFGDWTINKEIQLLEMLDIFSERGIRFALSNVIGHMGETNELLEKWSEKYHVYEITSNYNNSNYQSRAKEFKTREVVITNYVVSI